MANVLVIGSGGREHALGWKLAQSPHVETVYNAPGNGGTKGGKFQNIPLDGSKENFPALYDFVNANGIDLVVVGPEAPLDEGLVDFLQDFLHDRSYDRVFGPTQAATQLEADKFFSYELMSVLAIPQARSHMCSSPTEARETVMNWELSEGIVLKSRGLTGGKGVTVCEGKQEALEAITRYNKKYGRHILIAERLVGEEFSVFGISDGNRVVPLEISVQDHKRLNDNDQGPNTGGMGAYCPAPVASAEVVRNISDRILTPVVREMADRGTPYRGFLYAGMMMTKEGPKVLEFNVRFGDPECQPAMMLLKSDLYKVLTAALDGKLDQVRLEFNTGAACCVVLAAPTYPHSGSKGLSISGIADAERMPGIKVFHAGTRREGDQVVTAGGRVLGVTAYSPAGIREARDRAYAAVERITVQKGFHYRTDIAGRALQR